MFLIHGLNMRTRGETGDFCGQRASSTSSLRHSLTRSSASDLWFAVCVDTLSHAADSGNKEEKRCHLCQPEGTHPRTPLASISQRAGHRSNGSLGLVRLVPCPYLRPVFLHFRRHPRASRSLSVPGMPRPSWCFASLPSSVPPGKPESQD